MRNGRKMVAPVAFGAAALLALSACTTDVEAEADDGDGTAVNTTSAETSPSTETTAEESPANGDEESTETVLPPGGAERVADEDIDPETQGQPIETGFSEAGRIIGFNESAGAHEPVDVYAEPPVPSPDNDTPVVAQLSSDDEVMLAGREIVAVLADGVWVEIELADGYGWVESHLLEGFEGP